MTTATLITTTATANEPLPVANVIKIRITRDGIRTVQIRCPLCRRRHWHGWPAGNHTIGARVSHCAGWGATHRTYLIATPTEEAKSA